MTKSIIDTVTLALTLVFAIPVGLMGGNFLLSGQTILGSVFVVIAVLMVLVEEYLTTPTDLPGMAAKRVVGTVAKTEDETEQGRERS
jgi:hypothetical protein